MTGSDWPRLATIIASLVTEMAFPWTTVAPFTQSTTDGAKARSASFGTVSPRRLPEGHSTNSDGVTSVTSTMPLPMAPFSPLAVNTPPQPPPTMTMCVISTDDIDFAKGRREGSEDLRAVEIATYR